MNAPSRKSPSATKRVFSPAPFFSGYDRQGAAKGAAATAGQAAPEPEKRADVALGARIIMLLADHDRPMTTAEIAAALQTSEETLAEAIDKLVVAGVVHRERVRGTCLLDLVRAA